MELGSPLVASSSPLTGTLDGLLRLEAAGAGAVVLPSLLEEDLVEAGPAAGVGPGGQAGYGAGPGAYLSLAASTGVHTATDVLKVLLAGAEVAMMTSALLANGPDHLRLLEVQVRDWMDGHGFETLDQLRGRLSQRSVPNPAAFERANYIKTLASHAVSG
jgi:hypothetical protein